MPFYFYIFVLALCMKSIPVYAQLSIVESGMDRVAQGATQLYSANYAREFPSATEILNWRLNSAPAVQVVFGSSGPTLFNITSDSRFFASVSGGSPVYFLELKILDVSLDDHGTVDIYRDNPSAGLLGTFSTLVVQECNSTSGGDTENIDTAMLKPSSFNDVVNVNCTNGFEGSITMTCLADATWSKNENCTAVIPRGRSTQNIIGITVSSAYGVSFAGVLLLEFAWKRKVLSDRTLWKGFCEKPLLSYRPIALSYIIGSVFSIPGIIMLFRGITDEDMDPVETAGAVLGCLGAGAVLIAVIYHAIKVPKTDYSAGRAKT